jgi:hypothetical protein
VAPDFGGLGPGPLARPGSQCRATGPAYLGSKLTFIRLTEGCGNRALSDGVQSPQAGGSAPRGRREGSGKPARD